MENYLSLGLGVISFIIYIYYTSLHSHLTICAYCVCSVHIQEYSNTIVLVSNHLGLISESESVLDSTLHISWQRTEVTPVHIYMSKKNTN